MRALIQHVKSAQVTVEKNCVGSIGKGLLLLLGIHKEDTLDDIIWLKEKVIHFRIFDELNLSILDAKAELLIVSQFTLYADCRKGRRPSFDASAKSDIAKPLYETFVAEMRKALPKVETGIFGAHMEVALINDGPLTFLLDSRDRA